jgi:hypothetical protein
MEWISGLFYDTFSVAYYILVNWRVNAVVLNKYKQFILRFFRKCLGNEPEPFEGVLGISRTVQLQLRK